MLINYILKAWRNEMPKKIETPPLDDEEDENEVEKDEVIIDNEIEESREEW